MQHGCNMGSRVIALSSDWVGALSTAGGAGITLGIAIGSFVRGRIEQARRSMPIFRANWTTGPAGHSVRVEIVNRLNEDLRVLEVECKSQFLRELGNPDAPDRPSGQFVGAGAVLTPGTHVPAEKSGLVHLRVEGSEAPRWLRFTISSSAKTLSRKRYVIKDSQIQ